MLILDAPDRRPSKVPASSGSSPRYSKLRPLRGSRARLPPPASRTLKPLRTRLLADHRPAPIGGVLVPTRGQGQAGRHRGCAGSMARIEGIGHAQAGIGFLQGRDAETRHTGHETGGADRLLGDWARRPQRRRCREAGRDVHRTSARHRAAGRARRARASYRSRWEQRRAHGPRSRTRPKPSDRQPVSLHSSRYSQFSARASPRSHGRRRFGGSVVRGFGRGFGRRLRLPGRHYDFMSERCRHLARS